MNKVIKRSTILGTIIVLAFSLAGNLLVLALPRKAADELNKIFTGSSDLNDFAKIYLGYMILILLCAVVLTVLSNIVTENFAAEVRKNLINKVSKFSYKTVNEIGSSKLLTNLTSDVDAVKALFNQGIITIFSSLVLIIGTSISMLTINRDLALAVIAVIPMLLISFMVIFSFIGKFFEQAQKNLDKLNKVINENIVGAALTKVLNSGYVEIQKFFEINEINRKTNLKIVYGFASLIPVITILANLAVLAVVYFGGRNVIDFINTMGAEGLSPGDYTAFFTYVGMFIGPVMFLGFTASTIARSVASIKRIKEVLDMDERTNTGSQVLDIKGAIKFENVTYEINNKTLLKDISFEIKPGTKNAIVGPTAAGKTQIFNLIAGLQDPTTGTISIDGTNINDIEIKSFYAQVALVFQDSVIFNTSIKENILFNSDVNEENLTKAIKVAELEDFVAAQDQKENTLISERGTTLSGGQKQRLTLARALAINPKILLLDDFTARVDIKTEKNIIENLDKEFPNLTLLSITQKIESIKDYDQIFLIMEGELIAKGKHSDLLKNSFEYQQIYNSQQTTE
jgi:ATP-binding cassette subfamily B protein